LILGECFQGDQKIEEKIAQKVAKTVSKPKIAKYPHQGSI